MPARNLHSLPDSLSFEHGALGAGRVVVPGHHKERLAKARGFGADVAVDERGPEAVEAASRRGESFRVPVVIDTIGAGKSLDQAIALGGDRTSSR